MTKQRPRDKKRCSGHCCASFTLPYSPDELWNRYYLWLSHRGMDRVTIAKSQHGREPTERVHIVQDIHLIAPMVTYLGELPPPHGTILTDEQLRGDKPPLAHTYTCKHFDVKTRDCPIYEFRPAVCREYPYGRKCGYVGCTWGEKRAATESSATRKKRLKVLRERERMHSKGVGRR